MVNNCTIKFNNLGATVSSRRCMCKKQEFIYYFQKKKYIQSTANPILTHKRTLTLSIPKQTNPIQNKEMIERETNLTINSKCRQRWTKKTSYKSDNERLEERTPKQTKNVQLI